MPAWPTRIRKIHRARISVVDPDGTLWSFQGTEGAAKERSRTAELKAVTAAHWQRATADLFERVNKQSTAHPNSSAIFPSLADSDLHRQRDGGRDRSRRRHRQTRMTSALKLPSKRCRQRNDRARALTWLDFRCLRRQELAIWTHGSLGGYKKKAITRFCIGGDGGHRLCGRSDRPNPRRLHPERAAVKRSFPRMSNGDRRRP